MLLAANRLYVDIQAREPVRQQLGFRAEVDSMTRRGSLACRQGISAPMRSMSTAEIEVTGYPTSQVPELLYSQDHLRVRFQG